MMSGLFTILRYATLVPAYIFTGWYPKAGMQKPVKDTHLATSRLRIGVWAGMILIAIVLAANLLFYR